MNKVIISFNDLGQSAKNQAFASVPYNLVRVTVDLTKEFDKIFNIYEKNIVQYKNYNRLLIGHGLGSWWARLFAKTYKLPCILINPLFRVDQFKGLPKVRNSLQLQEMLDSLMSSHSETSSFEFLKTETSIFYYIDFKDPLLEYPSDLLKDFRTEGDVFSTERGSHDIKDIPLFRSLVSRAFGEL